MKIQLKLILGCAAGLVLVILIASVVSNARLRSLERAVDAAKQREAALFLLDKGIEVLLPRHRSVHITPTVSKASAGAIEYVPMALVPGLPTTLNQLKDHGIQLLASSLRLQATQ